MNAACITTTWSCPGDEIEKEIVDLENWSYNG